MLEQTSGDHIRTTKSWPLRALDDVGVQEPEEVKSSCKGEAMTIKQNSKNQLQSRAYDLIPNTIDIPALAPVSNTFTLDGAKKQ